MPTGWSAGWRTWWPAAGIIDHDVEVSEALQRGDDQGFGLLIPGEVGRQGQGLDAKLPGQTGRLDELAFGPGGQHEGDVGPGEPERNRPAYAPARARNQGDLAGKRGLISMRCGGHFVAFSNASIQAAPRTADARLTIHEEEVWPTNTCFMKKRTISPRLP